MFKKMASAITLAILLVFPTLTFAFGLGEIEIHSALNEPMNADIELIDFKPEQINELQVSLASQQLFERVGVPRPYLLTQLKFEPMLTSSGKPVIRVTSKDSIREPFLTFLIDARWSSGKLLREYTVLLDPPIFGGQAKANIESPKAVAPPRAPTQSTATPKPVTRPSSVPATRPAVPRTSANTSVRPTPPPAPQKQLSERPSAVNRQEQEVSVKRGDTLWGIAEPFARDKGVSVNQMMLAIQNQNPQGFSGNNINSLKSGVILRIPEDAASQYSSYEAMQEVKRQWQAWKSGSTTVAEQPAAVNVDASDTSESAEPVAAESATTESSADSKLSILGEEDTQQMEGGEGAEESLEALRNQVNLLKESAESKGEENQELMTRIESLESMLEKQEEIIKLQNEQLAQLQNVAANQGDSPQPAAEEPLAEEAAVEEEQPQVAPADSPEAQAESTVSSSAIPRAKVEPLPDFSGPIPDEMLEGEASQSTQEPIVIADEPVTESDSFIGEMMAIVKEHARNLIIGAGVLLVLILAWVAAKRRGSKEDAIEASGLPEMDDDLDDTVVASPDNVDETLDQLEPVDPEGMREPTMDSMDDDQGGEEAAGDDVIAEADVYISYNLYDQAEELLKDALKKDPSNTDYQIKLAEVYEGDGNQDGFVDYVKSIAPSMDKQSSAWTRIAAIGATLVPGHDLFSDQESDTALMSNEDASNEENDSDADENSLDFSMDEASEAESSEQESDDGEDEFEEDSGTAIMEAAGMDFGVDQDNSGSGEADADDTMSFSMDDLDEDEIGSADDSAVQQADVDETEAFMLDDDALGALNEAKASQEEQNEESSDDDNDVFIDLDQDSLEKELSADSDGDFDMSQANEDDSSDDDDELDNILNGTSETSIMKVPDFNEDGSLSGDLEPEEDTVSLEQVQKNLTSELETLSFEDADLDLDNDGDDESSLPTLQTKELGRGDVDLENIHDLDEDLTASETGTFEADMLAGEVTEQFDANNLDNALDDLDDLGDFANSSDDLEAPSVAEEIGTKLDLAKAFVDMGDEDAAKETLTEVIDMGDETQIAEAKALLDKLP